MEPNEFIDELLVRNEYYVNIEKFPDEKLITINVNYQGKEFEGYNIAYSGDNEFCAVQYYHNTLDENCKYELFYLPTYAVRIFIFMHIMKRLNEKQLDYNCIRFFDEKQNRVEKLNSLIPNPISEEDKKKELTLDEIIAVYLIKKFKDEVDAELKELGMFHVFYMLKGLIV